MFRSITRITQNVTRHRPNHRTVSNIFRIGYDHFGDRVISYRRCGVEVTYPQFLERIRSFDHGFCKMAITEGIIKDKNYLDIGEVLILSPRYGDNDGFKFVLNLDIDPEPYLKALGKNIRDVVEECIYYKSLYMLKCIVEKKNIMIDDKHIEYAIEHHKDIYRDNDSSSQMIVEYLRKKEAEMIIDFLDLNKKEETISAIIDASQAFKYNQIDKIERYCGVNSK